MAEPPSATYYEPRIMYGPNIEHLFDNSRVAQQNSRIRLWFQVVLKQATTNTPKVATLPHLMKSRPDAIPAVHHIWYMGLPPTSYHVSGERHIGLYKVQQTNWLSLCVDAEPVSAAGGFALGPHFTRWLAASSHMHSLASEMPLKVPSNASPKTPLVLVDDAAHFSSKWCQAIFDAVMVDT